MRICEKSQEVIVLTESNTFDEDKSGESRKCKLSWGDMSLNGLVRNNRVMEKGKVPKSQSHILWGWILALSDLGVVW